MRDASSSSLRGGDERAIAIDAAVVPLVEVGHEVDAAAQRAAADVDQRVLRTQAFRPQEIELQRADFVPEAADQLAVGAGRDFLVAELAGIGIAGWLAFF